MDIALIGYGSMGKRIHSLAEKRGHSIVSIISPSSPKATSKSLTLESLNNADIAIDFSLPELVLGNVEIVLQTNTKMVIGTTGWYKNLEAVEKQTLKSSSALLWSSNFSIGVQLYFRMVKEASKLMNIADEYDVWGNEIHHYNKIDSPSGTAKTLETIILNNIERKTKVCEETLQRKIEKNEFHFTSTRGGSVNFEHTIGFDSSEDCIKLSHSARNRDGYVLGVLKAAEWVIDKKGFYSFDDYIEQQLKS